jgi:hypothetical protein
MAALWVMGTGPPGRNTSGRELLTVGGVSGAGPSAVSVPGSRTAAAGADAAGDDGGCNYLRQLSDVFFIEISKPRSHGGDDRVHGLADSHGIFGVDGFGKFFCHLTKYFA